MIFRIGKTNIKLSFSFIALIAFMVILCDERIIVFSLIASFLHEFGHLIFLSVFSESPKKLEFSFYGIGIGRSCKAELSYRKEAFIASGGIISNFFFGILFYAAYVFTDTLSFFEISAVNIIVAAINSIPVYTLDCGRVIRYILLTRLESQKAELIAIFISSASLLLFTAFTVVYLSFYGINISIIAINLYLIFITIIKKWS